MSQRGGHGLRPASRHSSVSPIGTQLSAVQFAPRHEDRDARNELPGIHSPDVHHRSSQQHHHQQQQQHYQHQQHQHQQQNQHYQQQQQQQHQQNQHYHQQQQQQHHQHHHSSSKALGVHNILNPSEPRSMASEAGGRTPSRSRDAEGAPSISGSSSTTAYGSSSRTGSYYPGHVSTHSLPATPVAAGVSPFGRPPISEHNSPVAGYHPFSSSFGGSRKPLSPRPPRALSISHPPSQRVLDARQPPALIPSSSPVKRPYEADTPDEPRAPPGLHHPHGMASIGQAPLVTPPRSISQPLGRQIDGRHVTPPSLPTPGDLQGRSHVLPSPVQFGGISAAPPGPPLSAMPRLESPTEASPAWPEMLRRQGFSGVEPQQAFMTLPGSDTPIPVQVDYSQASKKADEKRQRNAKASTRHRRKKKTLQEENMKQLQELKDERSQMLQQMEELLHQRNFYRDERNRLKDLVLHTPAISKHAAGPPSPVSTKSVDSIGDRSPATQQHIPTPTQGGYSSEASSVDHPPPPRRRADERAAAAAAAEYVSAPGGGYGMPSGSAMQHGLPPVQGQAYGVPPRASPVASSAGIERLPPLRAMEGHPGVSGGPGLSAGQRQEQDLRTGQWRAAQATHYETGWATAPRKPYDAAHQWQ